MNISMLLELPGKVIIFLSGKKTYMVGLAMMLMALAGELNALANVHSVMDLWALIKAGASDPNAKAFLEGLAIMTGRAAVAKLETPA